MDLVIEGRALLETGLTSCCIGVTEGRISKIAKTIQEADRRLNFHNLILMPAGVDLHVHFREPGMTHKEDFGTGSMAAAAGGTSYVLDMPNTQPPTRTAADVKEKIASASRKSFVDFGVAALLDLKTDIESLVETATALKMYIGETTGDLGVAEDGAKELLRRVASKRVTTLVHAEHVRPLEDVTERDLRDHDGRRSEALELEASQLVFDNVEGENRVHLLHVTQSRIIEQARRRNITTEVTPHHLFLDTGHKLGAWGKINPPLRSKRTRVELWNAFRSGAADTLGSDHSPHTTEEKEDDFDSAPSGMPGVETRLPLMLNMVARKKLDLSFVSRCCSTRPAEILWLRKGKIAEGYDADIMAVDFRKIKRIRADELKTKCGWTAFEGMKGIFPKSVMIRGEEIASDGEITGERTGRFSSGGESG